MPKAGNVVSFPFNKAAAIALYDMAAKGKDNYVLLDIAKSLWNYPSNGHWGVASERANRFALLNPKSREDYMRFCILRDARKEIEFE